MAPPHPPPYLQPEHLFKKHTNTAGFCFLVSIWTGRLSGESISAVWLTLTGFISQSCERGASWETAATCPAASAAILPTTLPSDPKFNTRQMSGKCVFGELINRRQLPEEERNFSRWSRLKVTVKRSKIIQLKSIMAEYRNNNFRYDDTGSEVTLK